jgi:carboxyl-terminal processing protease
LGCCFSGAFVITGTVLGNPSPDPLAFAEEWSGHVAESALEEVSQRDVLRRSLQLLLESSGEPPLAAASAPDDVAEALAQWGRVLDDLSSRPGQRRTRFELAEEGLRRYLATLDPYARYRTAKEMAAFAEADAPGSAGVGMELVEQGDKLVCFPLPNSSAERAGIPHGQKLLAVDGHSVEGLSLFEVARLIRGNPGTKASLRFDQRFGRSFVYEALREAYDPPTVLVQEEAGGGLMLRPRRIDSRSVDEIRALASSGRWFPMLTLDLRGCQGGKLEAAAELADLFLPEGAVLGSVRGRNTREEYLSRGPQRFKPLRLKLLHNQGTASAAEFVLGALLENGDRLKLETSGERTYGKAMAQVDLVLSHGGVLRLSTSRLYLPSGKHWEGEGLDPGSFPPF